jgi:hypothetical protein
MLYENSFHMENLSAPLLASDSSFIEVISVEGLIDKAICKLYLKLVGSLDFVSILERYCWIVFRIDTL